MKTVTNQRSGFTIVELLVVVAIIIVLAALSFTLVGRGTRAAEAVTCMNNMRQVVTSHLALAQDNNGAMVHAWETKAFGSWRRNWSQYHTISMSEDFGWREKGDAVNSRMRTVKHFQCPTAAKLRRKEMSEETNHNGWRTYALNQKVGSASLEEADPKNTWIDGARTMNQVQDPSRLILFAERSWDGSRYPASLPFNFQGKTDVFFDGHGGKTHVAFFDGHVEKLKPQQVPISGGTWANGEAVKPLGDPETSLTWRGRETRLTP